MQAIILGCGNIGSSVARKIGALRSELKLIIADKNLAAAELLASEIGNGAIAYQVDVTCADSLNALLLQGDVVLNTIGPFYRTAIPVIEAAINAKINYVDINDDHDVAVTLVTDQTYDQRAKDANIIILLGCGATPGFTNVLAKLGCERLDKAKSIRLSWVVPLLFSAFSPAILEHLFHMLSGNVTQFIDGRHQQVPAYGGERDVEFLAPFKTYSTYFSGHGEPVTLGHFIPGLEEATIRSCFFPQKADDLMRSLVECGFGSRDNIPGVDISPLEFLSSYIKTTAGQTALSNALDEDDVFGFASQIEVCGERDGKEVRIVFEEHQMLSAAARGSEEKEQPEGVETPHGVVFRQVVARVDDDEQPDAEHEAGEE